MPPNSVDDHFRSKNPDFLHKRYDLGEEEEEEEERTMVKKKKELGDGDGEEEEERSMKKMNEEDECDDISKLVKTQEVYTCLLEY